MKVFMVSDMEGVAGIVKWQQVDGGKEKRSYHEGRELYTEEINAGVHGATVTCGSEQSGSSTAATLDHRQAGARPDRRRRSRRLYFTLLDELGLAPA